MKMFRCSKCGACERPKSFELYEVNGNLGPTTFQQLKSNKSLGQGYFTVPMAECSVPDCGGAMFPLEEK